MDHAAKMRSDCVPMGRYFQAVLYMPLDLVPLNKPLVIIGTSGCTLYKCLPVIIIILDRFIECIFCRNSGSSWLSSIVMWGIIAAVAYYIYQCLTHNPAEQYPCMMSLDVKNNLWYSPGEKPNSI